jgi:hypothetical protein
MTLATGVDGSLYVGGAFTAAGGKPSSRIARWTGAVPRPVAWLPAVLIDQCVGELSDSGAVDVGDGVIVAARIGRCQRRLDVMDWR